jgi:hypothetical protein
MADIKQAAQWMKDGIRVRRKEWKAVYEAELKEYIPVKWDGQTAPFTLIDILADDWEIAP